MIVIGIAILGVVLGVMAARQRGGNKKDMAQYGAGFGLFFLVNAVLLSIILERLFG